MTRPKPSLTSGSKICASSASPTSVSGTSSPRSLIARISALLSSRDDLQDSQRQAIRQLSHYHIVLVEYVAQA
jgi:hypothetical protein